MAMEMTVKHTILVTVVSHKSGGRARVLHAHPFVVDSTRWSDTHLTSRKFYGYTLGTRLVVRLSCSQTRRQILHVEECNNMSIGDFIEAYKEIHARQAHLHDEVANKYWNMSSTSSHPTIDFATSPEAETSSGLTIEKDQWLDEKVFIRGEDLTTFNACRKLAERRPVKALMIGPSGYGKTSVPEALARSWDMKFLRWDCANVRDPEEFFGYREAVDGSTKFVPTEFTKAVREGNCIIVLDELNRLEPYLSNSLFPMLDHTAKTIVHGEEIEVGENVIFFATINVGYQFTGTFQLDSALLNRFDIKVLVRPLPNNIETELLVNRCGIEKNQATKIISVMRRLREMNSNSELNLDASTRVSLQIGDLVGVGLDIRSAFAYAVMNGIEEDESKKVADVISSIISI